MRITDLGNIQPSGLALHGPSGAGGTPEAFGAKVGEQLSSLASTVDNFSTYLQQKQLETQRFTAMQQLTAYQQAVGDEITQRSRQYDPSTGNNFTQDIQGILEDRKNAFIGGLPPALQQEFGARVAEVNLNLHQNALKFQIDATDQYARDGLSTSYSTARDSLDQDGSQANFDSQKAAITEKIDASGLSAAEKIALKRQYYVGLEAVSYKAEVMKGKASVDALGVGAAGGSAITLIQSFSPNVTDQEAADQVKAASLVIAKQVPPLLWAAQSDPVKAALLSAATSEKGLPDAVVEALKNGDPDKVAASIAALGGDQHKAEADVILGKALLPPAHLDADPRYADIPYEDRLALRKDAEAELNVQQTAQAAAEKAQHNAVVNSLEVASMVGKAGQADLEAAVNGGILTDYDEINKVQGIIDKYQADAGLAVQGHQMLDQNITFNPSDEHVQKVENALVGIAGLQAVEGQDKDYAMNTLIPMVRQMQDVPTELVGQLKGMIRSPDTNKAIYALDLLSQIQQATPRGYDARTDSSTAADVAVWQAGKDYYQPGDLLKLIQGGQTQEERVRSDALRTEARGILTNEKVDHPITGDVLGQLGVSGGGLFGGAVGQQIVPWAASRAMSEFNSLFEVNYAKLGNVDAAKKAAISLLKQDWGTTTVGGNSILMKFPPDKYYPPINGNFDWITKQGAADLKLRPGEKFQLIADEQTAREIDAYRNPSILPQGSTWGNKPVTYQAVIIDNSGTYHLFDTADGKANRLGFDTRPFAADQAAEWEKKRSDMNGLWAGRQLQEAMKHAQETGIPIPPDVLHDLTTQIPPFMFGGM